MTTCFRCSRTLGEGLEHWRRLEGANYPFGPECIQAIDKGDAATIGKAHRARLERRRDLAAERMRRGRFGAQPATFWWLAWVGAITEHQRGKRR